MEPLQTNHEAYRFLAENGVLEIDLEGGWRAIATSPGVFDILRYAKELIPRVNELYLATYWAGSRYEVFCVDLWFGRPDIETFEWVPPHDSEGSIVGAELDIKIADANGRHPLFMVRNRSVAYPGMGGLGEQSWVDCYVYDIMNREDARGLRRFPAVSMEIVQATRSGGYLSQVRLFQIKGGYNREDEDVKKWFHARRNFVRIRRKEAKGE